MTQKLVFWDHLNSLFFTKNKNKFERTKSIKSTKSTKA